MKELKYMIHHHLTSREHYDFRLECNGVLLSWAVPKGPSLNPSDRRLAVMVSDHDYDYKDFEGIIPKGSYGAGTVMIWDEGTWEIDLKDPLIDVTFDLIEEAFNKGSIKFIVHGKRLNGKWSLVRFKGDGEKKNWILAKQKDEFARDEPGISEFVTSIRTGRTQAEIADE